MFQGRAKPRTVKLDVETLNAVLRMLDAELAKHTPGTPGALVLWAFKQRLDEVAG